ncbi:MAG TPA: hypothetical protein VMT38_12105 [Terracidiphilus sp.]|nr:hypothetical protein [Terracidiphilus sp.]
MSLNFLSPLVRCMCVSAAAVLLTAAGVTAGAQSSAQPQDQSVAAGSSSSRAGLSQLALMDLPSAPEPEAAAAGGGQYGQGGGYNSGKHGLFHHLTFEIGGGFNAPQSSAITFGGQFQMGGGFKFNPHFSALIEYQFIDDKLPGALISETGASGGYAHIWSFTLDPVVDLMPKASNDFYITGGGGFYRKVTSFTDPEEEEYCDYYYGYCGVGTTNAVVGHFSSNQGGFNVGGGYQHRFGGGMYGEGPSSTAFFVEARYLDIMTPAVAGLSPNGLNPITTIAADTKLIPVSVGVRW